jgi:hypothetical protein
MKMARFTEASEEIRRDHNDSKSAGTGIVDQKAAAD